MERETKELTIGSHTLTVKTYATARETQAIQGAYFKGTKISVAGGTPTFSDFDPSVQFAVHEEMIRQLVIQMDGSAEGIIERCLELPNEEYQAIVREIDELISKKN